MPGTAGHPNRARTAPMRALIGHAGGALLAACRREHSSPWHARSVGQHSNTLVRFCIDTTCCSDRRSVGFGRARSQPNVPIPPAYVLADATGTLSPGAGYAIASD